MGDEGIQCDLALCLYSTRLPSSRPAIRKHWLRFTAHSISHPLEKYVAKPDETALKLCVRHVLAGREQHSLLQT